MAGNLLVEAESALLLHAEKRVESRPKPTLLIEQAVQQLEKRPETTSAHMKVGVCRLEEAASDRAWVHASTSMCLHKRFDMRLQGRFPRTVFLVFF